ncbi:hypothetical protein BSKO_13983 [Bryopsis sp. KO-2023]|nr:hypothetical protein BSKO_13983 [Bryopsis sp. KO-2023]
MGSSESLRARGTALAEKGCFERAIELFESHTELDKDDHVAFELLAQCLMEVDRDDDAYVAASRAVELDPGWSDGYLTLARAARNSGYLHASIAAFLSCIDKGGDASVGDELQEVESLCMARISSRVGLSRLKIKQKFGDGSGPGCVVWTCGLFLAWYLANRVEEKNLKGTRILELGSGTGIGAIAAACCGAHVSATDLADALPLLSKNIDLNSETITDGGGSCHSSKLDWSAPHSKIEHFSGFDLVMGADLVYSETQIEDLCTILGELFSGGEPGMQFLLVHKTRDPSIDRKLLNECRKAGVDFTVVEIDTAEFGCEQELQNIHLYRALCNVSSCNGPSSNAT